MRLRYLPAFLLAATALFLAAPASAHQPRVAYGTLGLEIYNPEVSKAYYGELHGDPVTFRVVQYLPFDLYVNILQPNVPAAHKDVTATIKQGDEIITTLGGPDAAWERWYEEFAGDWYLKGPEFRHAQVPAGTYDIVISSPDNMDPYVLAVGETESFPASEMLNMIAALPVIKMQSFHKSPFAMFEGIIGHYLLIGAGVLVLIFVGGTVLAVRRVRKTK